MALTDPKIKTKVAEQEIKLMKKKSKIKSNVTLCKNIIITIDRRQDIPSRREVNCACQKMDLMYCIS